MTKISKPTKTPRKIGRPSTYSDTVAAKICERMAEVAVDRLNACLPKVEVTDVYGAKALAETVAILVKLVCEVERGQATGADAQRAMNDAEDRMSGAEVVDLWRKRHADAGQRCEP